MKESGWAIWITGPPASGKSTITQALKKKLTQIGVEAQILESEIVGRVLTPNPTHSPEEQETFHNALVYIGVLLTQNGVNIIFDATAYKRRWRRAARGLIDKFLQAYIRCPFEVRRERDQKGAHRKEATGEAYQAPNAQYEYEEPWHADIELDCLRDSPDASAEKIMEAMRRNDFI